MKSLQKLPAFCTLGVLLLLVFATLASAGTIERVSVSSSGGQGNRDSENAAISADGRYVVFTSLASTLASGDSYLAFDVFVHDRQDGTTERLARLVSDDGMPNSTFYPQRFRPAISADGRYVSFISDSSDLVTGDTNGKMDVFVYDRQTGTTERVSVASDGSQGNGMARDCSISADGRYVAFMSDSPNLGVDADWTDDPFVHDRQTGQTEMVGLTTGGELLEWMAQDPEISANGEFVVFHTTATNVDPGDTSTNNDIYVRDLASENTEWVSMASDGGLANSNSTDGTLSADGRFVAFRSGASNLVAGDTNGRTDIFVRDRQTGQTERVSVASDGTQANSHSYHPTLSADGRVVAFCSSASNLVAGDTNQSSDIFVHDRQTGQTERVSVAGDGTEGYQESAGAYISADGRFVAFESFAPNLVAGDTNEYKDIFVHDRFPVSADFTASPPGGEAPLTVSFTDLSNGDPTSWEWDLGDGTGSLEQNPSHEYADPGRYTVSLTVPDAWKTETETKVRYITVTFQDVLLDHWACNEVLACVDANIVSGYDDGLYRPDTEVTRDQMAVYISRALAGGDENVPDPSGDPTFPDVLAGDWGYKHVEYAAAQNVVAGYEDGLYHPEYQVTRDQMAVYVARALVAPEGDEGLVGYVPADPRNFPDVPATGYGDSGTDPYWAYKHIEYSVENGVVQGYEDGYYHPADPVTRDQMAVYIARAFGLM
jgi:PKD repeat protein